ncbi:MAG: hypothetical protein HEQ19_22275 [Gloeotrichia echinulata CP02]
MKNFLEIHKSVLIAIFGMEYYTSLIKLIKQNNNRNIISLDNFAIEYPEFKDRLIEIAKRKLKSESKGLDLKYEESATKKFINFDQGLKFIKPLLNSVTISGFGTIQITNMILSTFTDAVGTTNGFLSSIEYHNSRKALELYRVEAVQNSNGFKIFYLNMEVDSKKIENFLYNESETKLQAECKVKSFANLQSLLEWSAN